jgi:hypothetical protein
VARIAHVVLGAPVGHRRPGFVVLALLAAVLLGAGAGAARAAGQKGEVGLGVILGGGSYRNHDFNRDLTAHGFGPIDSGVEYGFGADYRFSRWFSVGFEVMRVGADAAQPANAASDTLGQYGAVASPLAFNLIGHVVRRTHGNVDLFVGGGPLLAATIRAVQGPFELEGRATGVYLHAGAGFEVRFSPMVGLGARGLVRHATANHIDLRAVSGDPNALWNLDFSGVAFSIGPRIYFGNVE